jgi:hypothetical protein
MKDAIKLVEPSVRKKGKIHFDKFLCFCGNEFIANRGNVRYGNTNSCGCLKSKMVADKNTKHGLRYKNERLYNIWKAMRQRCYNEKSDGYKYYGAKGVTICKAWDDYYIFYIWAIENGYSDNLTIERRNPNGVYEPDNCTWATTLEQARNKRDTIGWDAVKEIRMKYNQGASVKELSEAYSVDRSAVKRVLNNTTYTSPDFKRNRTGRVYKKNAA